MGEVQDLTTDIEGSLDVIPELKRSLQVETRDELPDEVSWSISLRFAYALIASNAYTLSEQKEIHRSSSVWAMHVWVWML